MVGDPLNRAADGIPVGAETPGDVRRDVGCARTRVTGRCSVPAGRALPLARSAPRATATPAPVATLRAASTPSAAAPARILLRPDTLSAYAAGRVAPGHRRRRPSRLCRLRHRREPPPVDAIAIDRRGRWRGRRRPGDWSSAMVLIEEVADGGWALATMSSPSPCATSSTGQGVSVFRSGRMKPSAAHDEVGGRETPPERHTVMTPARAGPARRPPGPGGTGLRRTC